jgi:hypothetical protein
MEKLVGWELAGNTECLNASLPTTIPTGTDLELKQGRHGENPAIGHTDMSCFRKKVG